MLDVEKRRQWLRVLSCATTDDMRAIFVGITCESTTLRAPEVGLAMVTGRVGATGSPFGLGEMTMTRCVVQVGEAMGVGYVRGRDPEHARQVAVADALLQGPRHDEIVAVVLTPLAETQRRRRRAEREAGVETSRVQFLTMVRGN